MTGKNHVLVSSGGVISLVAVCGALIPATSYNSAVNLTYTLDKVVSWFYPDSIRTKSLGVCLFWTFVLLLFLSVGAMFPDIDNKKSLMGRYLHLPFRHRTWTHSIWFILILFPMVYVNASSRMFWFGYVLHILEDMPSAGGVCVFYPFQQYREYPNGARVVRGHKLKLYYTAKQSESWFVFFLFLVFIITCIYFGFMLDGFRLWFDAVMIG